MEETARDESDAIRRAMALIGEAAERAQEMARPGGVPWDSPPVLAAIAVAAAVELLRRDVAILTDSVELLKTALQQQH